MRLVIVKDDNSVAVNGESHTVDCSDLPADFHALQWDGVRGEIEYRTVTCEHCGGRSKKPNEVISDPAPYRKHMEQWDAAKLAHDKAMAEEEAKANAARPES